MCNIKNTAESLKFPILFQVNKITVLNVGMLIGN